MTRGFPELGDIFFVTEGATMGFTAINTIEGEFALAQRTLTLNPFYPIDTTLFHYFLMSPPFQKLVQDNATGTAATGIKGAKFRSLNLPFPPLAEQAEIVSRVTALFTVADQMEEKIKRAQKRVDKLTSSILVKSFRGELVSQDPNDETAEIL
jgi:type I restriction enzyme, S subunit